MSSANALCASRVLFRRAEGGSRTGMSEGWAPAFSARRFRTRTPSRRGTQGSRSSLRSSESSSKSPSGTSSSEEDDTGVSVAARREVRWPMGRGAGWARASRSCEGRRSQTRSDGSRTNAPRREISKLGTPLRSCETHPMSELSLATRELKVSARRETRDRRGGLLRRHHAGERHRRERQHLLARASQQWVSSAYRDVDQTSIFVRSHMKEVEIGTATPTCSSEACARRGPARCCEQGAAA